jgi:hypothetical protein
MGQKQFKSKERAAFEEWAATQNCDLDFVDGLGVYDDNATEVAWCAWFARAQLAAPVDRLDRAERALRRAGFQDLGGEEWKPPLGKPPIFIEVSAAPVAPDVVTDRDISELIGVAQFLQTVTHWEAQASVRLLAEFTKKLLDAKKAAPQGEGA